MASEFVQPRKAVFHFISHFGYALDDAGERVRFQRGEPRHTENREVLRGILVQVDGPVAMEKFRVVAKEEIGRAGVEGAIGYHGGRGNLAEFDAKEFVRRGVDENRLGASVLELHENLETPGGWVALAGNIERIECRGDSGIGREILSFGFGGFFGGFKKHGRNWTDDFQLF